MLNGFRLVLTVVLLYVDMIIVCIVSLCIFYSTVPAVLYRVFCTL